MGVMFMMIVSVVISDGKCFFFQLFEGRIFIEFLDVVGKVGIFLFTLFFVDLLLLQQYPQQKQPLEQHQNARRR